MTLDIVKDNIGRVKSIAGQFPVDALSFVTKEDLEQIGWEAVIEVSRKDIPELYKKKAMSRAIRNKIIDYLRKIDHMPRDQRSSKILLDKAKSRVEQMTLSKTDAEKVAHEAGISLQQYFYLISLAEIGATTNRDFDENIDSGVVNIRKEVENRFTRAELSAAVSRLSPSRRLVIRKIYYDEIEGQEVARMAGVHPSRITQLKEEGLNDLRGILKVNVAAKKVKRVLNRS